MKTKTETKLKKYCAAWALALACLFLSSCSLIPGYVEPEDQSVVAAMGFDADSEGVKVSVQLAEGRVLTGRGGSVEDAISSLVAGETRTLEVTHLAVIALGKGIDVGWLEKIMDYCNRNEDVSVSAQLVSCTDAEALLSLDGARGYELSGAIGHGRENASVGAECRLYQVSGALLSDGEGALFALPYFTSEGGALELYGVRIYVGGEGRVILDRVESAHYMMMRGLFGQGLFGGDSPGLSGSVGISDCRTRYELSRDDGSVSLKVICEVTLDSELANDEYADEICRAARRGMESLYAELSSRHGDLFGFGKVAAREGITADELTDGLLVSFECIERG